MLSKILNILFAGVLGLVFGGLVMLELFTPEKDINGVFYSVSERIEILFNGEQ